MTLTKYYKDIHETGMSRDTASVLAGLGWLRQSTQIVAIEDILKYADPPHNMRFHLRRRYLSLTEKNDECRS